MSARQISKAVGMPVNEVMAILSEVGEYVKSPASMLKEPVIRRLYEALQLRYESEKPRSAPPWDWKGQSNQTSTPRAVKGDIRESERSEWHSRAKDDWWETQSDIAPAWELASWKILNFSEAERDAWIAHGLRPGQVKDAARYTDAGFLPGDLARNLHGWTVLKRLRAGDPAEEVLRLLRRPPENERAI